ncbi:MULTISPECIES: polysaccharide biosynthesis C-terminal domain-containing protein [unclassified Bradyrhizobium]|uniref:polysaccharide biosynthesis C-terminal domain-containing protein n=1 Tax=unclassified Bradyrhizobium TaxID=2631580 RepID=UPI002FF2E26E
MLLSLSCLRVLVGERLAHADPAAYEADASKAQGQQESVWAKVQGTLSWSQALALTDQAVVSAASFLTTILIGRFAQPSELGLYSMGFSLLVTCLCILESLISTPYTIHQHRSFGMAAEHAGASLGQAGLLSALVAVALAATAWGLSARGTWPELGTLLWVLAAVAPLVMLREFCRRLAFAHLRMAQALILDTAVAAIQLAALGWMGWTGHLSAVSAYAALGGACAVACIVGLYVVHASFMVRIDQIWAATKENWGLGKWLLAVHLTSAVQGSLVYWLLAWLAGTTATGIFAACMSIALLSNPLILGAGNLLTPKLALAWNEGGGERLRRESIRNAMWLGAAMVLFCVAALLVGEVVMQFLYEDTNYADQGHTITVLMVAMLVMAIGMPANDALTSMKHPRVIFWTALWAAVVTGSLVWCLVVTWGSVGAAYGILAGNLVKSTARWIALLSLVPRTGTRTNSGRISATPIPSKVLPVLQQLAPGCKTNDWIIEKLAEGVEASIYHVQCSDHHLPVWQDYCSVVIKLYKPWLSPDVKLVRCQFELLSRLHTALDGSAINGWKISIPTPVYICESPLALVTSRVTGKPLGSWLDHGNMPPEVFQSLPHAIIAAMNRLWSNGLLHGDLTLDNILCDVGARSLSFVDAGRRRTCSFDDDLSSRWEPASHDLAHMLYDAAVSVLNTIVSPVACARKRRFAEGVVLAFVETIGSLEARGSQLEEIRACVRLHLMALDSVSWSPRGLYQMLQRQIGRLRLKKTIGRVQADAGLGTAQLSEFLSPPGPPIRERDLRSNANAKHENCTSGKIVGASRRR